MSFTKIKDVVLTESIPSLGGVRRELDATSLEVTYTIDGIESSIGNTYDVRFTMYVEGYPFKGYGIFSFEYSSELDFYEEAEAALKAIV